MCFHGPHADKQGGCCVAVGGTVGNEFRDALLRGGELRAGTSRSRLYQFPLDLREQRVVVDVSRELVRLF